MKKRALVIKNLLFITNIIIFGYLIFIGRNQYLYNMNYFKCILFMLINCLFVYTYGILLNEEKIYKNNVLTYIFLFILLLISFTFFIGRTSLAFYTWGYTGQYTPFYTTMRQIKYGSTALLLKNIVGNIVMLIPLSFLLMIKNLKNKNILRQSVIIIPIIIIIEVLQAFTHTGSFDIDDIILNYIGVVVFTFLITRFKIVDKVRKIFYTDFKLKLRHKKVLFYISLTVLIVTDIVIFIN